MKVFIPITDEILELGIHPDELVAYHPDQTLLSEVHSNPVHSRSRVNRSPGPTPNSEATPALSSSTYMAGPELG